MFLAVHAAVGALAGNAVQHPSEAFVLGVVSHFFIDMIPHGDEVMYEGFVSGNKVKRAIMYVGIDAIVTAVLIAVIFIRQDFFHPVSVEMGIIGSLLPDLLVGLSHVLKPKKMRGFAWRLQGFQRFHMRNHHFLIKRLRRFERDISLYYGLALQALLLTVLVKLIL